MLHNSCWVSKLPIENSRKFGTLLKQKHREKRKDINATQDDGQNIFSSLNKNKNNVHEYKFFCFLYINVNKEFENNDKMK